MTRCAGRTLLIRINFILGTPANPRPALDSQIYEWDGNSCARSPRSRPAAAPTSRSSATATATATAGSVELIVTNSLTPELRFAAETVRFQLSAGVR